MSPPALAVEGLVKRYYPSRLARAAAFTLAADFSVMLAPGSAFGYEGYLRVGVGQRPDIFAEGLRRSAIALDGLRAEAK
jgi:aspartate/methionine/tyrosine aminotransferase